MSITIDEMRSEFGNSAKEEHKTNDVKDQAPFAVRHSNRPSDVDENWVDEYADEIEEEEAHEHALDAYTNNVEDDLDDDDDPEGDDDDPYLEEAIRQGYDPNYEGPNKRSPFQFIEHGKVLKHIHKQNQEIAELREFAKMQAKATREAHDKAQADMIKSLKRERREAMEEQDWDKVEQIDDDIDELRSSKSNDTKVPDGSNVQEYRISAEESRLFIANNPWVATDHEAAAEADKFSNVYAAKVPDATGHEIIEATEAYMKAKRPELFKTKERPKDKPGKVARRGRTSRQTANTSRTKGVQYKDLDAFGKRQCDLFERNGIGSREEFLKYYADYA